jgi:hypothetical protein
MNIHEQDVMKKMLQDALPPVGNDAELQHDLWSGMLRRLDQKPAGVPWFDWALAGGLLGLVVLFPASIPLLLYCM